MGADNTIIFIDEQKGVPYSPQVILFDEDGSIGKFYQKRIFFLSKKPEVVVGIPSRDNNVFFIYNIDTYSPGDTLNSIRTSIIKIKGTSVEGSEWNIYCVNIGAESDIAGSYTETLRIDGTRVDIRCEMYGEREENSILLHNQGVDLPKDIYRAFYDTDIHDNAIDWIVLNRKYKELLLNAAKIIYNKGSYVSLLNSLKWFEYGDMLKLYEFWSTPEMIRLHQREMDLEWNDAVKELSSIYMKTTFIAVSLEADKMKEGDTCKIIYEIEDGECTIPITEEAMTKWSIDDLMLKMTLLGNYFSTFFMPIHLDLLYSSIERRVFATPAKEKKYFGPSECGAIIMNDKDYISVDGVYDEYVIGDAYCSATAVTPLMSSDMKFGVQLLDDISNKDTYKNTDEGTGVFSDEFINNFSIGTYAVIPISLSVKTHNATSNNNIIYTTLIARVDDKCISTPVALRSGGDPVKLNIYIKSEGSYSIGLNLIGDSGIGLSKSINVKILSPASNHFNFQIMSHYLPDATEINSDVIDNNFSSLSFEGKRENMDLKYPDHILHGMLIFTHISGNKIQMSNGEEYIDASDMNYKLSKANKYYIFWRSIDGGEVIYIIMKSPGEDIDLMCLNSDDQFTDKRFVRFLWRVDDKTSQKKVGRDNIIRLVPQDSLVEAGDRYVWRIMSRGNIGEVRSQCEPMVYCDNSGECSPGLYSVSLDVKYDGVTVRHERKNIYRYDFSGNNI